MIFIRDEYERYEALSPLYQGDKVNPLPMLFTIFESQQLDKDVEAEVLASIKETLGLFELTDPTYPRAEWEDVYVQKTGLYLHKIHTYGADVVLGEFLADVSDKLATMNYVPLARLSYAKRSQVDMLLAQAMAFCDVVFETHRFHGKSVSSKETKSLLETLLHSKPQIVDSKEPIMFNDLAEQQEIQAALFVDRDVLSQPDNWAKELLQIYKKTKQKEALDALIGLHALLGLEDVIIESRSAFEQWMLSSEVYLLMTDPKEPIDNIERIPWDIMLSNLHLSEHVHNVMILYALYELDQQYHLEDCQVIASYLYTYKI